MAATSSVRDRSGGRPDAAPAGPAGPGSRYLANNLAAGPDLARQQAARQARWALRRGLWRVTKSKRLAYCGRVLTGDYTGVRLKAGAAYYDSVQTCGSVWACPVCAATIRQRRALEVERIALAHLTAGHSVGFLTTTLPHQRTDELRPLLRDVTKSWESVQQARAYRSAADGLDLLGFVRATEITYGAWHGWHPHLHTLLFAGRAVSADEWQAVRDVIATTWADRVEKRGRKRPGDVVGVTLVPVATAGVGRYLAKVQDHYGEASSIGREMQRGDLKRGRKRSRTPFELAELAAQGVVPELPLWWDYEAATKGARAIGVSRGVRAAYGWDERSDEELAREDVRGEPVTSLDRNDYRLVVQAGAETLLLDLAEDGGAAAVHAYLRSLHEAQLDP